MLRTLAFLEPAVSHKMSLSAFDLIGNTIPVTFDKGLVKLEYREFTTDNEVDYSAKTDAVAFWVGILNMKSPLGELKYHNLATLALQLLAIPVSNADSESIQPCAQDKN